MTTTSFHFRWLGVTGLEFTCDNYTLLIDPYLSRISLPKALFSKVRPDENKIFSKISAVNSILVTHSHFDHLMDVPAIAKRFGCTVYGSPNTCALLKRCDVPLSQIREVVPGNDFSAGPFHIKVLKSSHSKFPFIKPVILPETQDPPRHALDFGMDTQFSYRISMGPITWLTDPGMEVNKDSVDILFVNTMQGARTVGTILKTVTPGVVIPYH